MATYVKEATRGRTLHLLEFDKKFGQATVYLDASKPIKEALKDDENSGFPDGGPAMAQEVEKARNYADYVSMHANIDDIHNFNTPVYTIFTENSDVMTPRGGKSKQQNQNARTNVSV